MLLSARHVVFGKDRERGALGDAQRTVDALLRIDGQEIRAFVETIDRANLDTIGVFAVDAVVGDYVGRDALFADGDM